MPSFIDRVRIHVTAGNGGHGCASVRREKYRPLCGPDGGDGGDGGSIILKVDSQITTLLDFHHLPHRKAENGTPGQGGNKEGAKGSDLVLYVPNGTVVKDLKDRIIADLQGENTTMVLAAGGQGGKGNASLASKRRKAPGFALLGEPGEEVEVILELKSVADVALVGFPSAGKSSLIAAVSAARPKIADYPFTTLVPNLGVVSSGDLRFTMADVPGLIPGASEGKGLGLDFLRHIERCAVIAHVVDCASFEQERNPVDDIKAMEAELAAYQSDLEVLEGYVPLNERPRVIILNKMDISDSREIVELVRNDLGEFGWPIYAISAVTGAGCDALIHYLAQTVEANRVPPVEANEVNVILRPEAKDSQAFSVTKRRHGEEWVYQVRGSKPERWVRQTDFKNEEAIGFLADRLAAIGVEEELAKAGAVAGDTVVIGSMDGGVIFDWEPTLTAGAELLGARGEDLRLHDSSRRTITERRAQYHAMMVTKAAARGELEAERKAGLWTEPE